jgi:hypothetical protein
MMPGDDFHDVAARVVVALAVSLIVLMVAANVSRAFGWWG